MTKAEQIKKRARKTIMQLKGLQRLINSLIKAKTPQKVRPRRKKAVKRKPLIKKRENDEMPITPRGYGISSQAESSWEERLSSAH